MTLWTPDGEHTPTELTAEQEEQARQMAHELSDARARLLEADPATVIANHALGLYELAALHLTSSEPDLAASRLSIDAMAALVEGLAGRLGDVEPTLKEGLANLRLLYVQRSAAPDEAGDGSSATGAAADAGAD